MDDAENPIGLVAGINASVLLRRHAGVSHGEGGARRASTEHIAARPRPFVMRPESVTIEGPRAPATRGAVWRRGRRY